MDVNPRYGSWNASRSSSPTTRRRGSPRPSRRRRPQSAPQGAPAGSAGRRPRPAGQPGGRRLDRLSLRVGSTGDCVEEPGRIVLLTASHRVAPGLLSWPAWETLRAADLVLCADPGHPQLPYLREAGIDGRARRAGRARSWSTACAGGRTVVVLPSGEGDRQLTDGLARLAGSGRVQDAGPGAAARLLRSAGRAPARPGPGHGPDPRASARGPRGRPTRGSPSTPSRRRTNWSRRSRRATGDELREELGDVLLQVVFHARIAQEGREEGTSRSPSTTSRAAIVEKLIHRHPHVFGDETAETPRRSRRTGCGRRRSRSSGRR